MIRLLQNRSDLAQRQAATALDLAPSGADSTAVAALIQAYSGKPQEALKTIRIAKASIGYRPGYFFGIEAVAHRLQDDFAGAIDAKLQNLQIDPENCFSDLRLAIAYQAIGDSDAANLHGRRPLLKNPAYMSADLRVTEPISSPLAFRRYATAAKRLGLPAIA